MGQDVAAGILFAGTVSIFSPSVWPCFCNQRRSAGGFGLVSVVLVHSRRVRASRACGAQREITAGGSLPGDWACRLSGAARVCASGTAVPMSGASCSPGRRPARLVLPSCANLGGCANNWVAWKMGRFSLHCPFLAISYCAPGQREKTTTPSNKTARVMITSTIRTGKWGSTIRNREVGLWDGHNQFNVTKADTSCASCAPHPKTSSTCKPFTARNIQLFGLCHIHVDVHKWMFIKHGCS